MKILKRNNTDRRRITNYTFMKDGLLDESPRQAKPPKLSRIISFHLR